MLTWCEIICEYYCMKTCALLNSDFILNFHSLTYFRPRLWRCWPISLIISLSVFDISLTGQFGKSRFWTLQEPFFIIWCPCNNNWFGETSVNSLQPFPTSDRRLELLPPPPPGGGQPLAAACMSSSSSTFEVRSSLSFLCGGNAEPPSSLSDEEARLAAD